MLALRTSVTAGCWIAALIVGAATGCISAPEAALERLLDARRLAAELLVQFTKGADASNRAVMAGTDDAVGAFAREAEQAAEGVRKNADALGPILQGLGYSNETRQLEQFGTRFAEYRALDRNILQLAVESTNLKAQRLSFGPAREAADAFRDALEAVAPLDAAKDGWRVKALVAEAVTAVREIQALHAPHIAEPNEAPMNDMERQMAAAEASARRGLGTLASLIQPASKPRLAEATAALERFTKIHVEIIDLSRRNTNVQSLALSLGQKRTLTAACEDSLRALQDALAKRGFTATR